MSNLARRDLGVVSVSVFLIRLLPVSQSSMLASYYCACSLYVPRLDA